jgi:SAM-dependent methyltransferase
MNCVFCDGKAFKQYNYPASRYNGKLFQYVLCKTCRLVQIDPLPDEADYAKMYSTEYQENKVDRSILEDTKNPLAGLRFSYNDQFVYIKNNTSSGAKLLDYGCGNGHFISNAYHNGFHNAYGAEFNPEMVALLQHEFPSIGFYTIEEILTNPELKFDAIRLSNVLEHLTNPKEVLAILRERLTEKGILILEGPIEANFYIMNIFNRLYFDLSKKLNPNKLTLQPPFHIFFSNAENQLKLFETIGLEKIDYRIVEHTWPYGKTVLTAQGIKNKFLAFFAIMSKKVSNKLPFNWGNTFLYIGRK